MSNQSKKKHTLAELSQLTEAQLVGDPNLEIYGVDSLESAGPEDASFFANPRYQETMRQSKAGVICVPLNTPVLEGKNFLLCENPSRAFQILIEVFLPREFQESGFSGIHPTAVIHPTARIGQDVHIGPYCVIDKGCVIGDRSRLISHVFIGAGSSVGTDCLLHAHASVRELCTLGNHVILQPGAVIGSCGFGYIPDEKGNYIKLEQVGGVTLEDHVEIGANTTVDRARFKTTRISRGTKIDNLVQIGHNVHLGPNNIIVAQTGISGSAKTGKNVIMGGQAGVVGHIEITDNVMIATRGGVSKSVTEPGKYGGGPLLSLADFNRQQVHLRNIVSYVKQIEVLEEKVKSLEEKLP